MQRRKFIRTENRPVLRKNFGFIFVLRNYLYCFHDLPCLCIISVLWKYLFSFFYSTDLDLKYLCKKIQFTQKIVINRASYMPLYDWRDIKLLNYENFDKYIEIFKIISNSVKH